MAAFGRMAKHTYSLTSNSTAMQHNEGRNLFGSFKMWGESFPLLNYLMYFLAWFTVPIEVLFRRNFGERWLSIINFYVGLLVLGLFASLQSVASMLGNFNQMGFGFGETRQPPQPVETSFFDSLTENSMTVILVAYILIGSYHFFRMWWRNQTNTPLHSFDDGTSRLEPLSYYFMQLVNVLAIPVIRLYMFFLPKSEQRQFQMPPLVTDLSAFTNTVFEPFVLLILSFLISGTASTWLFMSAFAVAIFANWKETAKLNKALDFRDSVIEAKMMSGMSDQSQQSQMSASQELIMRQVAHTIETTPQLTPVVKQQYPDLMSIIEDMNNDKSKN